MRECVVELNVDGPGLRGFVGRALEELRGLLAGVRSEDQDAGRVSRALAPVVESREWDLNLGIGRAKHRDQSVHPSRVKMKREVHRGDATRIERDENQTVSDTGRCDAVLDTERTVVVRI